MIDPVIKYLAKNQVILALLLIALGWLVLQVNGILVSIFISYIIMAALSPLVEYLIKQKIPRVVSVAVAYISVLFILVILILPLIPFFTKQLEALISNFPYYFDQAANLLNLNIDRANINRIINSELANIGHNAFELTSRVFGGLFTLLTIFVVSFYLLVDRERVKREFVEFLPLRWQDQTHKMITQVDEKLGAWLRGQIVLSLFIGLLTWVVLTIIGLEFALPLAVLAGILEIIPTLGPIIASIPAIIIALNVSPTTTVFVILAYILIQAIENNLLVPKIMEKAVGINPIAVILAVTVGAQLMGVIGALLSVPFVSMLTILFNNLREYESNKGR